MIRIIISVMALLLFASCDELNTTQREKPKFFFDGNIKSLPADGISWIAVTIKFQRLVANMQPVTISTSHGSLIEFPVTTLSSNNKIITVNPSNDEFKFILLSSSTPENNVLLSVTLNNIIAMHEFEFRRVCPTELLFDFDDQNISLAQSERSIGSITLLNNGGPVSDDTRIDVSLNDNSLAQVEPRLFYSNSNQNNLTIIPNGNPGSLEVTATLNQEGCNLIEVTRIITIE